MNPYRYKYKVYSHYETDDGWGGKSKTSEVYLGETFAVSEKQAINNVRYRRNLHHLHTRYQDTCYDSCRVLKFRAERV